MLTTYLHSVEMSSTGHFKDILPVDVQTLHLANEGRNGAGHARGRRGGEGVGVIAHHANVDVPVLQDAMAAHCVVCGDKDTEELETGGL